MGWLKYFFLIIFFSIIFCIPGANGSNLTSMNKDFVSLVFDIVNDVLDLMPEEWAQQISPAEKLDKIINSVSNFDSSKLPFNDSIEPDNMGIQAAYVVEKVFGKIPPKNIKIPQTVYYEGFKGSDNLEDRIRETMSKISSSKNIFRDKYNLALSIMTDLLINDFIYSGEKIGKLPKEGVYLRDSKGNLYLYEEGG